MQQTGMYTYRQEYRQVCSERRSDERVHNDSRQNDSDYRGEGLYKIDRQARRIAAIRGAAKQKGVELFINARTDLFIDQKGNPALSVGAALDRAKTYAGAGASGFFIPGLRDDTLIGQICEAVELPVNVMIMDRIPPVDRLRKLGVSRISYGPIPYINAMDTLEQQAEKIFS